MAKSGFRFWAFKRRAEYGFYYTSVMAIIVTLVYFMAFYTPGNCFDNIMNGNEDGVDCGGSCVRMCAFAVNEPQVDWSDSFAVADGQYNAVAYVTNRDQRAGTPEQRYTFGLYDESGLIVERSGSIPLGPNTTVPIFEGRIDTQGRIPTETRLNLAPVDLWLPADRGRGDFRTVDYNLSGADTRPRLNVRLENLDVIEVQDVEIIATIFDSSGRALTASRTVIDRFLPRTQQDVVFTWPNPIAKTVRTCDVPSDIMVVLDRSGSMAADGGDPPEPLESAKRAAMAFVQQLRSTDQVGYFSYATTASSPLEQVLSADRNRVLSAINATRMGQDGVQYTNMGQAFAVAAQELLSARHRDDARKVIVFVTDGDVTRPLNPRGERDVEYAANYARAQATTAKGEDIIVYTIGFGDFFADTDGGIVDRDIDLIRDLASAPEKSYLAPSLSDLERVYTEIAQDICEDGPARIDILAKPKVSFPQGY